MPINTVLTVNQGNTAMLFVSGKLPEALIIGEDEPPTDKQKKLTDLDALYDLWVESAHDPTKSPYFRYGRLHGFLDGYVGSLFFIDEDERKPEILLAHVFEDFAPETYDTSAYSLRKGPKKYGIDAAREYKAKFSGPDGFESHLQEFGVTDYTVRHVRYKNGRTYP